MLEEDKRHPERQAQCGGAAVCPVEVRGASLGKKNLKEAMEGAMRKTGGRKFEVPRTNSLKQKQEQE